MHQNRKRSIYLNTDKEIHITPIDRVSRFKTITSQKLRICRHSFDVFFRTSNYTESLKRKKRHYPPISLLISYVAHLNLMDMNMNGKTCILAKKIETNLKTDVT